MADWGKIVDLEKGVAFDCGFIHLRFSHARSGFDALDVSDRCPYVAAVFDFAEEILNIT